MNVTSISANSAQHAAETEKQKGQAEALGSCLLITGPRVPTVYMRSPSAGQGVRPRLVNACTYHRQPIVCVVQCEGTLQSRSAVRIIVLTQRHDPVAGTHDKRRCSLGVLLARAD